MLHPVGWVTCSQLDWFLQVGRQCCTHTAGVSTSIVLFLEIVWTSNDAHERFVIGYNGERTYIDVQMKVDTFPCYSQCFSLGL